MKALTFHAPGDVRLETVPEPELRDPHDAIVRVELTALCGSDLHVWRGREAGLDRGTVMGHEFLGNVVDLGVEVESVSAGMQVVAPFTTCCGTCFYCRAKLPCRCERGELFGWIEGGRGLQGAQAEYVRVPLADATLVAVPGPAPGEEVLFAGDILATGFFAAELGDVRPGQVVVVLGCGPVGLMTIIAARDRGAARVLAVDSVAHRLALAELYGAEPLDLRSQPQRAVAAETEGRGADVVLEVVGSREATRLAYELVRAGGTIAATGVHTEERFAVTPGEIYDKNLTYRAGRCPARRFMPPLIERVMARAFDLAPIISHRLPLSDGPDAYRIFDAQLDGCTKVILRP